MRRGAMAAAAAALVGCGSAAADSPGLAVTPVRAVLGIDQLAAPGFTRDGQVRSLTPLAAAAGDRRRAAALSVEGWQAGAAVRYTRSDDFATANGPLDVSSTAQRFARAAGAAGAFAAQVALQDAPRGAVPVSTGPLGDQAHADSVVRPLPNGLMATQITLAWRVENVLNVIVIRGRTGGTTLADALALAAAQTGNELTGPSPRG